MVRHLAMGMAILLAALGIGGASAQPAPARIVAVGDLHGDYDAWLTIARAAGLVDSTGKWAAGRTTLVQLGDVTDRGPDSLKIIRHLQRLEREARAAGGRLIVLVGNHEAMMVTGDYRYVHPGEYAAFVDRGSRARREAAYRAKEKEILEWVKARDPTMSPDQVREAWFAENPLGKVEHNTAWAPGGELGRWAAGLPAVVKLGDTLFVHAGISANYALVPLDEINRRVRTAMTAGDKDPEAVINDQMGPLWYRGLVTGTGAGGRPTAANELAVLLKATGAKRLVIGHTPAVKGIVTDFDGRLVRIDTGISTYYGGVLSWIEIAGGKVTPRTVARGAR
jgi:hypothetical protein